MAKEKATPVAEDAVTKKKKVVESEAPKVAEKPVSPITSAGDKEPTLDVEAIPVSPITSAGDKEPTLDVETTPVTEAVASIVNEKVPTPLLT